MKPTVFRARVDEYDESLNEINEIIVQFPLQTRSSFFLITDAAEYFGEYVAQCWNMNDGKVVYDQAYWYIYTVNILMQQARFLDRNKL